MRHRKWGLFGAGAESMEGAMREHNALYDAWDTACCRATETLDENNRLDRELDEARKRIAELEAPTRVPFSDAQIERMAQGAQQAWAGCEGWENMSNAVHQQWRNTIRAALAAGGIEPCAPPEYDPADVALAPTGTVLRDRLVEAEAKIERQRAELEKLNHLRQLEAGERAALRDDIANAVRNAMEKLTDAPWRDKTATEAVWLLSLALRAQPSSDTGQLPEDQVEALARLLRETHAKTCGKVPDAYELDGFRNDARAAIAHLRKRPEGLPTREQMAQIIYKAGWCKSYVWDDNDSGSERNQIYAEADAILAALAAGGIEPCAPPEYDPADVALGPTGHVLRDRLVEAERKVENQRMSLRELHEARGRDAAKLAAVTAERDHKDKGWDHSIKQWEKALGRLNEVNKQLAREMEWTKQYKQDRDDALAELEVVKAERDKWEAVSVAQDQGIGRLKSELAALRERDAVPVSAGVPSVEELVEIALGTSEPHGVSHRQVAAIRDRILAGLAQPSSKSGQFDADEAEALARVLHRGSEPRASWDEMSEIARDSYRAYARAAIAHMRKRPEGLPTPDQFNSHFASIDRGLFEHDVIELIYDYLAPYLRDAVGKPELDVTAEEALCKWLDFVQDNTMINTIREYNDWLRSRIRPTYERKECAKNPAQAKLDLPSIDEFRVKVGENCGGGLNWVLICMIAGALHEWLHARAALEGE